MQDIPANSQAYSTAEVTHERMEEHELQRCIDDPEVRAQTSSVALTEALLDRAKRSQPHLNAFFALTPELSLADARRVDLSRANGTRLPLDGMQLAIKDNIDVAGAPTTVGSIFFKDLVADRDSEAVRRVREAGAVIIGKSALHEFVYGTTCTNPWFGQTFNPWDLERIPGGSSGGSGAALAADLCIGALGSDTGGSIRIPSSLNGIAGLRPTLGAISNRGAFPLAWSLDTVGPMARHVTDVAALFGVLTAYDAEDPHSKQRPSGLPFDSHERKLKGLRIGVPRSYFFEDMDPEVLALVEAGIEQLRGLGALVKNIDLPGAAADGRVAATTIMQAEGYAVHRERFDSHPEMIGPDIRTRLAVGRDITGLDCSLALERLHVWRRRLQLLFDEVDLLVTPTTPLAAPLIATSENISTTGRLASFTYPWSAAGSPALSVPCGFLAAGTAAGMPAGMQLCSAPWNEELLFTVGRAYQSVTDWHERRPASGPFLQSVGAGTADS